MKTKWKNRLEILGILCSLPMICLACGRPSGQRTLHDIGNSALLSVSQEIVSADKIGVRGDFLRKTDRENAPAQTEFLLDDESAEFSNGWAANTTDQVDERFGNRFAYAAGVGSVAQPDAVCSWEPVVIQQTGWYQVSACWTAHENRAPNAPYTLSWKNQSVTVPMNQQTNGGIWNPLQSVYLEAGDILTVSLSNNADGYVIADGIRISLIEAQEELYTVTVVFDPNGGNIRGKQTGLSFGESTTLTAQPSDGWRFVGWYQNDRLVCSDPDYTLTVTQDTVLSVRFERIPVDRSRLESLLFRAKDAKESGLYQTAVPSMQRLLAQLMSEAEKVLGDTDATQKDVDQVADRLEEFLNLPILQAADKENLKKAVERAEQALEDGLYDNAKPTVRQELAGLLADARELLEQEDALQESVDEVCRRLTEFLDSPILPNTDKSGLRMVLDYAERLDLSAFSDKGKQAFSDALRSARTVYESLEADQETVNSVMLELLNKTADLRIAPEN